MMLLLKFKKKSRTEEMSEMGLKQKQEGKMRKQAPDCERAEKAKRMWN